MKRLVLTLAISLFATSAFAAEPVATLVSQQGTVLVNQDDVFVTATDAQALRPGDRIMVMEGGLAEVSFADGCSLPLESGSLVVVPAQSTCAGAVASVQRIGPSYAQLIASETDEEGKNDWIIFVAGAAVVGALIAHSGNRESGCGCPVSP